jgi:hypothetical protein
MKSTNEYTLAANVNISGLNGIVMVMVMVMVMVTGTIEKRHI